MAIKKSPNSPYVYQFRSFVYLTLFKFFEAEQDARAALNLEPNDHTALQNLGDALVCQERLAEANDAISKALKIAPVYASYHYKKGFICYRLGEFENAVNSFQSALKSRMPFAQTYLTGYYYLANSLLHIGKAEEAHQAFNAMRQYSQEYPKLVALYRDAPDYPAVVQIRAELDEIGKYLV